MTEVTPCAFIQGSGTLDHPADRFRQVIQALTRASSGVAGRNDLAVSASSGMNVSVAAGLAVIKGTNRTYQGSYVVVNDAAKSVTLAAAHATLPRIDLVVARVFDNTEDASGQNTWTLAKVDGTPNASPVAPATPANALVLAQVRVNAAITTITSGLITDKRKWVRGLGGLSFARTADVATDVPSTEYFQDPTTNELLYSLGSSAIPALVMQHQPLCVARWAGPQDMDPGGSGGTTFTIDLTTEEIDTMSMHDTVSNPSRIICPRNGYYQLDGQIAVTNITTAALGIVELQLLINGVNRDSHVVDFSKFQFTTESMPLRVRRLQQLNSGDYMQLKVLTRSQVYFTRVVSARASMHWIGAI